MANGGDLANGGGFGYAGGCGAHGKGRGASDARKGGRIQRPGCRGLAWTEDKGVHDALKPASQRALGAYASQHVAPGNRDLLHLLTSAARKLLQAPGLHPSPARPGGNQKVQKAGRARVRKKFVLFDFAEPFSVPKFFAPSKGAITRSRCVEIEQQHWSLQPLCFVAAGAHRGGLKPAGAWADTLWSGARGQGGGGVRHPRVGAPKQKKDPIFVFDLMFPLGNSLLDPFAPGGLEREGPRAPCRAWEARGRRT